MISRRELLASLGAGATLALTPRMLRAFEQAQGTLIQRAIPSTGEKVPIIGVQFRNGVSPDPAALKAVIKTLVDNGGRFLDTMHQSVPGVEDQTLSLVAEMGVHDKLFMGLRGNPPGALQSDPAVLHAQIDGLLKKLNASRLTLVQLPTHADPKMLAALKEAKKDGRVRYIAATTIVSAQRAAEVETILRTEPIDLLGIDYAIDNRFAEEKLLPLALERKIGVIAYFPFSVGTLFQRAGDKPLPDWAADFDAKTWAQFFLKFIVSNPAVTLVRAGTIQAPHMLENIGGGIGRLPDAATRKRMAALIDSWPGGRGGGAGQAPQQPVATVPVATLDRYVGVYTSASGFTATFRRDGDKLWVKPGNNPEVALMARSQTRFQDPRGPYFEFQVDAQGIVTGAVLEQQTQQGVQKIPLTRK